MEKTNPSAPLWDMLADRWEKTLTAKGLSNHTLRDYLYTARRWSEWLAREGYDLESADARADHVDEFIGDIITVTSAANGAHHYRNLRVYWGWLVKREKITTGSPMDDTEPPRVGEKLTPLLSDEEHQAVYDVCGGRDFLSRPDLAIIMLFADTGLRVSELAQIERNNIDLAKRRFKIVGKDNRERWVG
jgi:site-specific recombinase XerC